jgi:hypothetical protein
MDEAGEPVGDLFQLSGNAPVATSDEPTAPDAAVDRTENKENDDDAPLEVVEEPPKKRQRSLVTSPSKAAKASEEGVVELD